MLVGSYRKKTINWNLSASLGDSLEWFVSIKWHHGHVFFSFNPPPTTAIILEHLYGQSNRRKTDWYVWWRMRRFENQIGRYRCRSKMSNWENERKTLPKMKNDDISIFLGFQVLSLSFWSFLIFLSSLFTFEFLWLTQIFLNWFDLDIL